eukprot:2928021-Amphidinium_carterae.1
MVRGLRGLWGPEKGCDLQQEDTSAVKSGLSRRAAATMNDFAVSVATCTNAPKSNIPCAN